MKKIIITLCAIPLLLCSAVTLSTNEDIYTFSNNVLTVKSKFINPFYNENYTNITPYKENASISLNSRNNQYHYDVKLLKYKGWDNELGDFTVIDILNDNKVILSVKNDETWTKLKPRYKTYSDNDYFITVKLSDTSIALIITGFSYPTEPSLLTIIILEKGTAKLVFNKGMYINNITKTDSSFSMITQSNIQQWDENNKPLDAPIEHKIWSENGVLKFENL